MKRSSILFVSAIAFASAAFAAPISPTEKAAMQSAMFQHIDRQLVDGVYFDVDMKLGEVRPLVPAKNHPMILRMGEHFVLCTDFKTKAGESVNVDFYISRRGKAFVIVRAEINNRSPLMALMEAGKVVAAE